MALVTAVTIALVMAAPKFVGNLHDSRNDLRYVAQAYLEQQMHNIQIQRYTTSLEQAEDDEFNAKTESEVKRFQKRVKKYERAIEQENTDFKGRTTK